MSKLGYGLKCGLLFGVVGIPFSIFFSMGLGLGLEGLAKKLSVDFWDFSMYVSIVCLLIPVGYYINNMWFRKDRHKLSLNLLFVGCIVFLNVTLFYYWYNGKSDGQLGFALLIYPVKTAIIYPIVGFFHDLIIENSTSLD